MFISKFTFGAFRSFHNEQTISFAIPDRQNPGSGLTYIVGENNAGKTSILEAMHFSDGMYNQQNSQLRISDILDDSIHFTLFDDTGTKVQDLAPIRPGSFSLEDKADPVNALRRHNELYPIFIPARRYWSPITLNRLDINNAIQQPYGQIATLRQRQDHNPDNQIADLFRAIESDDDFYSRFNETMKQIFPEYTSFSVTNEDSTQIVYRLSADSDITHRADFLGDGVSSVMRIVAHLIVHNDRAIIIDEPELSLHPAALKRLGCVLANFAKTQQIVLATHSPYLVSWNYIQNGAKLHRVIKFDDSTSNIFSLQAPSTYRALLTGTDWQQPHVADVVAKEIFFTDNILFLEGQEDVGLLRKDGKINANINIFGYGVHGFPNFKFALQLAKDIGIQKAGAIIDKGEKEDAARKELEEDFPNYCVLQWDRNDIRDKPGSCLLDEDQKPIPDKIRLPKNGYFDEHGHRKEDMGDYEEKIAQINDYFNTTACPAENS